ncbi:MAG: hypothetical protein ACREU2_08800, partial [Steroidobacteraceae bacterium]
MSLPRVRVGFIPRLLALAGCGPPEAAPLFGSLATPPYQSLGSTPAAGSDYYRAGTRGCTAADHLVVGLLEWRLQHHARHRHRHHRGPYASAVGSSTVMSAANELSGSAPVPARQSLARHSLGRRLPLQPRLLAIAAADQHFSLTGRAVPAAGWLVAAGGFALAPARLLVHTLFAIEGAALHWIHGLGGLAFIAPTAGEVISDAPLINYSAMAPFAIMGAAQALMHSNQPRNAAQSQALRRFIASLTEFQQFAHAGNLGSPQNARR